jgi:hypothetical protein
LITTMKVKIARFVLGVVGSGATNDCF